VSTNLQQLNRSYSSNSQSAFLRLVEDLGRALEPTPSQLETLERSYNSTGEFLVNCDEFKGQLEEIHPQGSRALGTLTRPLRDKEGFDVDLIARLNGNAWSVYSAPGGATRLLDHLHSAITRYATHHDLKLRRWERCVTLEYADGMSADIAPVIDKPHPTALHGRTHSMIPDRDLRLFQPTNPRGFMRQFDQIAAISPIFITTEALAANIRKADVVPLPGQDVFERLLCRLIQMMKLHRNIAFNKSSLVDLAPSSTFITALATGAYEQRARVPHNDQLDLLLDIIQKMPSLITVRLYGDGAEEWRIENPTAPGDNLASSMNESAKQQAFKQWHKQLLLDVAGILQSIEERQGLDQIASQVSLAFGEKAAAALQYVEKERQSTARSLGRAASVTTAGIIVPMTARGNTFFGV
jgi:hypothetical protein